MWIRSQDKLTLEELNAISAYRVYKNEGGYWHDYYDGLGDMDVYYSVGALGYYSSKEKALKVLDMIEEHLNESVFYMPLDEEVEV